MKNKATSHMKLQQVLNNIALDKKRNMKDGDSSKQIRSEDVEFSSKSAVVSLYPKNRTHWVYFVDE